MSEFSQRQFLDAIQRVAAWFQTLQIEEVIIVHHNDADGLSSGAILFSAIGRERKRVRRIPLEKPYPQALIKVIESIDVPARALLLLTDFASGMLKTIESLRPADLKILVLDHHQLLPVDSDSIQVLNPLQFDISGRSECCASTVCYLFAKALNPWNIDRASAALVGVMGDGQYAELKGMNRIPFNDAQVSEAPQKYSLEHMAAVVNALGSVGYFEGGCDLAVKGLVDGWGIEVDTRGLEYVKRFENITEEFIAQVNLRQQKLLSWFVLDDEYQSYGVKTVGLFCEELIKRGVVKGERYLLGMQPIRSVIPGIGDIAIDEMKVSMRVTEKMIGKKPLTEILPQATLIVGGFVDACHPHAAATTIPRGREQALIDEVIKLIEI